jgi:hypothetical protein
VETEGEGIFDKFRPAATETVNRTPFQSALYGGNTEKITIATVLPFSKSRKLCGFATAVVKHTENCLRENAGYPNRLHDYELSPDLRSTIAAFVRSNALGLLKQPKAAMFSRVENRFSNQETLRSILIRCEPDEKKALESAVKRGAVTLDPEIVEHVNHLSQRFLGDALLFCKEAAWYVADDYAEDLNSLFSQLIKDGPDVWQIFLSRLSDTQRQILAAIASLKPFSDEIRQLSGSRAALETVLHSINDISRKTLGEHLIEMNGIPPMLHLDDAVLLQRVLA